MTAWHDPVAPEVARLLSAEELAQLYASFAPLVEVPLAVCSPRRAVLAGDSAAVTDTSYCVPVQCAGDPAFLVLVASPAPSAHRVAQAFAMALDVAAHHAFAREAMLQTHEAAIGASFEEVTHAQAQLARSVTKIEEIDRLKANLLANMSHELRTPLTAILGYAELLRDGFAGPVAVEQRQYLDTIVTKAHSLMNLVNAVLDLAQREAEPGEPVQAVSLVELVRSELSSLWPHLERRRLIVNVVAQTDEKVVGHARRLRQVVACLLSNAVKFSDEGGAIDVTITVDHTAYDNGAVQLTVADYGCGISAAEQVRVFEPFFQADGSATRAYGGTGIGLALVKQYVEAHGGRTSVVSDLGRGATFRVWLPLAKPVSAAEEGSAPAGVGRKTTVR